MLLALDVSDILRIQLLEGKARKKNSAMKADNKEILEKKVLSYEAKSQEILGYEEKQLGLKRRNNDKEILSYEG
mgnify:CR=1 FL=1